MSHLITTVHHSVTGAQAVQPYLLIPTMSYWNPQDDPLAAHYRLSQVITDYLIPLDPPAGSPQCNSALGICEMINPILLLIRIITFSLDEAITTFL